MHEQHSPAGGHRRLPGRPHTSLPVDDGEIAAWANAAPAAQGLLLGQHKAQGSWAELGKDCCDKLNTNKWKKKKQHCHCDFFFYNSERKVVTKLHHLTLTSKLVFQETFYENLLEVLHKFLSEHRLCLFLTLSNDF